MNIPIIPLPVRPSRVSPLQVLGMFAALGTTIFAAIAILINLLPS